MTEQLISFETAKLAKNKRFVGKFFVEDWYYYDGELKRAT